MASEALGLLPGEMQEQFPAAAMDGGHGARLCVRANPALCSLIP
jgi:hypothetical protein